MSMPASLAASIRFRFLGTSIGLPSKMTVNVSFCGGGGDAGGTGLALIVFQSPPAILRESRLPLSFPHSSGRVERPLQTSSCSDHRCLRPDETPLVLDVVEELIPVLRDAGEHRRCGAVGEHADRHAVV